jgi:hypothetical protein
MDKQESRRHRCVRQFKSSVQWLSLQDSQHQPMYHYTLLIYDDTHAAEALCWL